MDDCPSTNDGVVTDFDTWQDTGAGTNPDVVSNRDRLMSATFQYWSQGILAKVIRNAVDADR
jgi:exo-beta-1,3-glucanase (GH17 family)